MAIRVDEIHGNQRERKVHLTAWDAMQKPSIDSEKDGEEFKKLLKQTRGNFHNATGRSAVREIDLLLRTCVVLSENVLDLQGFKRIDGRYNQSLVDDVLNKALDSAYAPIPGSERVKSKHEDAKGNKQLQINQAIDEAAAEKAAKEHKGKGRGKKGKSHDDGSTAEPASECKTITPGEPNEEKTAEEPAAKPVDEDFEKNGPLAIEEKPSVEEYDEKNDLVKLSITQTLKELGKQVEEIGKKKQELEAKEAEAKVSLEKETVDVIDKKLKQETKDKAAPPAVKEKKPKVKTSKRPALAPSKHKKR